MADTQTKHINFVMADTQTKHINFVMADTQTKHTNFVMADTQTKHINFVMADTQTEHINWALSLEWQAMQFCRAYLFAILLGLFACDFAESASLKRTVCKYCGSDWKS